MTHFEANRTWQAYLAISVEVGCLVVSGYFSWVAFFATAVAILTQAAWAAYLNTHVQE